MAHKPKEPVGVGILDIKFYKYDEDGNSILNEKENPTSHKKDGVFTFSMLTNQISQANLEQ